jgi:hypothetical protein
MNVACAPTVWDCSVRRQANKLTGGDAEKLRQDGVSGGQTVAVNRRAYCASDPQVILQPISS